MSPDGLPVIHFADAKAFERWLAKNLETDGAWLKISKKDSGVASVSFAEAIDVALCHGWIDGQRRALDEVFFMQRFTPRRARSKWSKINVDKVEALIAAGRMKASGLAQVSAAKQDGRWDAAYASPSKATIPDDLRAALVAAKLLDAFEALSGQNRYAILYRVHEAKRPDTRARRIAKFVEMLARGETIH